MKPISEAERKYIKHSCSNGIRNDGRGPYDLRSLSAESDILPNCNGSSRVSLGSSVDVVCGVKAVVVESSSDIDFVDVSVELAPSCSWTTDDKRAAEIIFKISGSVKSAISSGLQSRSPEVLNIIPQKYHWKLHIDLLILCMDVAPIDVCSYAALVALQCTVIPRTEVFLGESGLPEDFEVSGDIGDAAQLSGIAGAAGPLCVTVSKIGDGILLLDASGEEAACCVCSLTVAVAPDGQLCGIWKHGQASFTSTEMVSALKAVNEHLKAGHGLVIGVNRANILI